jgi:hypothetical protein
MGSSHGGNLYAGEVDSGNRVPRLIQFVQTYCSFCGPVSEEKRKELTAFTEAPIVFRFSGSRLTSLPPSWPENRLLRAPYMGVVCTDGFMADQLRASPGNMDS